jgi:hypothetical protein
MIECKELLVLVRKKLWQVVHAESKSRVSGAQSQIQRFSLLALMVLFFTSNGVMSDSTCSMYR